MPDLYMYIDSRVFISQVFSPYSVALAEFFFAAVQLALDRNVVAVDTLLCIIIHTRISIFRANPTGDTSIDGSE